jgi:hypothetical protein
VLEDLTTRSKARLDLEYGTGVPERGETEIGFAAIMFGRSLGVRLTGRSELYCRVPRVSSSRLNLSISQLPGNHSIVQYSYGTVGGRSQACPEYKRFQVSFRSLVPVRHWQDFKSSKIDAVGSSSSS